MKNIATVILFIGGLAFLSACESGQAADNSRGVGDPVRAEDSSVRAADDAGRAENDSVPEADNSARNADDRKDSLTSGDQSNAQADLDVTQKIRKSVVADDSLSINAQNVKIITSKGVVTLRGPVANAEEKANIGRIAQNVAGVTRVDNLIEIAN